MDIVVDVLNSEQISGWIRGAEGPRTLRLTLDGRGCALRADRPRADLAWPTAFRHDFDGAARESLLRGEAVGLGFDGEAGARVELRLTARPPEPIAFAIPAGQVNGRDDVSWYDADDVGKNLFHYHNIGDSFVYDSSLKILNFPGSIALNVAEVSERAIGIVNEQCCAVVLRGSNYFHQNMDWQHAEDLFRRIRVPIVCLGVGIQAPDGKPLLLNGDQVRMLRLLADRAESIGVRGARTAEELGRFGVKNVDIVGCPTLFRRRTRSGTIDGWKPRAVERVAFNIRREVSEDYARDAAGYLRRHLRILGHFDKAYRTTIMTHGEIAEKIFAFGQTQHFPRAEAELRSEGWFSGAPDDGVKAAYLSRIFYSDRVKDYDAFVRRFDLVTGYRLHGNLIALANGVPSFYFVYDERTRELCETFRIPHFDVRGAEEFDPGALADPGLFDGFNANFGRSYETMVRFLDKNGLPHRL